MSLVTIVPLWLTSMMVAPAKVRFVLKVSVPTKAPGETVPLAVRRPITDPFPVRVWATPKTNPFDFAKTLNEAPSDKEIRLELGSPPRVPIANTPDAMETSPETVFVQLKVTVLPTPGFNLTPPMPASMALPPLLVTEIGALIVIPPAPKLIEPLPANLQFARFTNTARGETVPVTVIVPPADNAASKIAFLPSAQPSQGFSPVSLVLQLSSRLFVLHVPLPPRKPTDEEVSQYQLVVEFS